MLKFKKKNMWLTFLILGNGCIHYNNIIKEEVLYHYAIINTIYVSENYCYLKLTNLKDNKCEEFKFDIKNYCGNNDLYDLKPDALVKVEKIKDCSFPYTIEKIVDDYYKY